MKRLILLFAALVMNAPAYAAVTAVVNVNVIPMTSETVLPAQTVIVENGRVVRIAAVAEVAVPGEATVIDGTDRYLMPGLAEMHGHVTGTGQRQIERLFNLFLANGVTTIRGMLGRPSHLALRDDIAAGNILGPRLITSGPSFNGNSVSSPAQGASMVRQQAEAGYDFLKIHPGLTAAEFNAIADAANELGIPFAGHVPAAVGVQGAIDKGIATIDHLDGYMEALLPADRDPSGGIGGFFGVMLAGDADDTRIAALAAATVAAGVANVPTESLFEVRVNDVTPEALGNRSDMRYATAADVEQWKQLKAATLADRSFDPAVAARAIELRRKIIKALHDEGAVLLLGSDAPQVFQVPGFSVHEELETLVAAGLTPFEALQTGTTAAAEFFGMETGTVEEGRIADLVLLDANPLDDIAHCRRVHGVFANGRWARASELLDNLD